MPDVRQQLPDSAAGNGCSHNRGACCAGRFLPGAWSMAGGRRPWIFVSRRPWVHGARPNARHDAAPNHADDARHDAPQSTPMMPGGPMPAGPYPLPTVQPFAFGPAAPAETPPQPPIAAAPSETGKPGFNLGFDPDAKESLPFEIPGQGEPEAAQPPAPAPLPASSHPEPLLAGPSFPGENVPASAFPAPTFAPSAGGQDFLQSAPAHPEQSLAAQESADVEAALPQGPPRVLHIRCPAGHLVKASSDLLGKNGRCPACKKTFELRYENSIEFQRRTEKIIRREEIKSSRAWVAWAFLATFLVFAGLVALMLALSR